MLMNSNLSDEMIDAYSKVLVNSGTGWTKEMFRESVRALDASGWNRIGGEVAFRAATENPKVIQGAFGKFLDASPIFFNESERMVRLVAWNTAYLEWRKANPNAKFKRSIRAKVLSRADDMSMNMTTASNAAWQRGFRSVPTQFWAYQVRLMEQVLGKRMDMKTRIRAFGIYSAIYGIPTGATGWFAFWPGADEIRTKLFAAGIEVDDTVFEAFVDGLPAVVMEVIAEAVTGQKEFDLDYPGRYAPQGLTVFQDLLDASGGASANTAVETFAGVIFGASGSITHDLFTSAAPAVLGLKSLFSSEPDEVWPIVAEDILDILTNISSASLAVKTYVALSTQRWVTRSGITLSTDVTPIEAIIRGITGTQSQEEADAFLKSQATKEVRKWRQRGASEAAKEISRARRTKDPHEFSKYMARAKILMNAYNLPVKDRLRAFSMSGDKAMAPELAERFQDQVLRAIPAPKNSLNRLNREKEILKGK
jgi:hypothetical protein